MSKGRDRAFERLKTYSITITLAVAIVLAAVYFFKIILPQETIDLNRVTGAILGILFEGAGVGGSLVAFLAVLVGPKAKWGEAADFRVAVGIGSAAGLIVSALKLEFRHFFPA